MTLAERFAGYALGLDYASVPEATRVEARRRVLDAVGCALGAAGHDAPAAAERARQALRAAGTATVLGSGARVPPDLAAFVNGLLCRYLDYNDTYLSAEAIHPSDTLAGLLAVAEAEGRGGRDLLAALVVAYEIFCRLADASSIRDRGWDHVTYGAIAVAAAAARLLGCTPPQAEHAINIAAATNVNLRQTRVGELSMWKGAACGGAARNAVFAAYLARGGVTGPRPVFEGARGFERQVSGPLDIPALGGEDGAPFRLMETAIKYWPAEYHSQAAIAAALRVRARHPGDLHPEAIEEIRVDTFRVAVEIIGGEPEKWAPRSRETADHSLPYLACVALLDGAVSEAQFTPDRLGAADVRALLARTRVVEEPAHTAAYPGAVPATIAVRWRDGGTDTARVDYPPGHPRSPLTDGQVEEKFRRQARRALGERQIDRVLPMLRRLDEADSLEAMMGTLVAER